MTPPQDAMGRRIVELEQELADLRYYSGAIRMAIAPGTRRVINGVA